MCKLRAFFGCLRLAMMIDGGYIEMSMLLKMMMLPPLHLLFLNLVSSLVLLALAPGLLAITVVVALTVIVIPVAPWITAMATFLLLPLPTINRTITLLLTVALDQHKRSLALPDCHPSPGALGGKQPPCPSFTQGTRAVNPSLTSLLLNRSLVKKNSKKTIRLVVMFPLPLRIPC